MANPIGPSSPSANSNWTARPKSKSTEARSAQQDADQADRNAGDQIARGQKAVVDAQTETDAELQNIRDSYTTEASVESAKNEDTIAKQKLKGYEELRDLKRQQELDLHKTRRDGERDLKASGDYYRDTLYQNLQKGEHDVQEQRVKQGREMEFVSTTAQTDVAAQKSDHTHKLEELKRTNEKQYAEMSEQARMEYDRLKTNTETAREHETQTFQGQFKTTLDDDQRILGELRDEANTQIRTVRQDTAQKLAAYNSRQSDPFYKMMDMRATLRDEGDRYVLTANIPSHEQEHIGVSIRGNTLFLSGSRRNEEKLTVSPGHSKGTSAYQSFEESFPMAFPVERNGLTKEFRGDTVIITVPKNTQVVYNEGYQKKEPVEKLRAERPQFPGNLPKGDAVADDGSADGKKATKKYPGSRTLG